MIGSDNVVLFMKGTRDAPQCGFSATLVQILDGLLAKYATYDVLSDPEIRNGIKELSDWPTVPQLYVRREFVGGCDIVRDMYAKGELYEALGIPAPEPKAPRIEVTDEAARVLRDGRERSQYEDLHLSVDARFQSRLGFGSRKGGEIEVEANGITLLLDPDSAARAEGMRIEIAETPEGRGLSIRFPDPR